jgi:hypothetical protein
VIHSIDLPADKVIAQANKNNGTSATTERSSTCLADDIQNKELIDKIKAATVTHCLSKHTECTGRYIDCTETFLIICTCSCHQEIKSGGRLNEI